MQVDCLNLPTGGGAAAPADSAVAAGAANAGAPAAGAALSAPEIAQMIAGLVAPLTQMIQDNRHDTQQYLQALATHQANTEQDATTCITKGMQEAMNRIPALLPPLTEKMPLHKPPPDVPSTDRVLKQRLLLFAQGCDVDGDWEPNGWVGATIRGAPMDENKERGIQGTQLVRGCILQVIVQVSLEDLVCLALQVVKRANHFDVRLGVAGLEQWPYMYKPTGFRGPS